MKAKYKGDNGDIVITLRRLRKETLSTVIQITEFKKSIKVNGIKCNVVENSKNDFIEINGLWWTSTFPLFEDIIILKK